MNTSSNHTTIHDAHPRSLVNLKNISSSDHHFSMIPNPTRRYFKKMALNYVYCPECEYKSITYYGKTDAGAQKHLCKNCNYQFVLQFDAIFPRSTRNKTFDDEFLSNIKPTGFQEGCGRKEYWMGARFKVLNYLESNALRIRFNKMIKTITVYGESDYRLLLRFIVDEAYVIVTE